MRRNQSHLAIVSLSLLAMLATACGSENETKRSRSPAAPVAATDNTNTDDAKPNTTTTTPPATTAVNTAQNQSLIDMLLGIIGGKNNSGGGAAGGAGLFGSIQGLLGGATNILGSGTQGAASASGVTSANPLAGILPIPDATIQKIQGLLASGNTTAAQAELQTVLSSLQLPKP